MSDVVVTVPKWFWLEWIAEGDAAGDPPTGEQWDYTTGGATPRIVPGDRVYIVAHGKLRGYAPLVALHITPPSRERPHQSISFIRGGGALAVTIDTAIPGFRGWRYRWWDLDQERPFPDWRTP